MVWCRSIRESVRRKKGFLFRLCEKIGNKAYYACVLDFVLLCLEMCLDCPDLCGTVGNVAVVLEYFLLIMLV